jgi:HTH-type transcriptional regulator/antitoxin HipB
MSENGRYALTTPEETALTLAAKIRRLRLQRKWRQATLAARAGVSLASLRRFERTGLVSLKHLLRLAFALGRLDDFAQLLVPPPAGSIHELEEQTEKSEVLRGSR